MRAILVLGPIEAGQFVGAMGLQAAAKERVALATSTRRHCVGVKAATAPADGDESRNVPIGGGLPTESNQ